MSRKLLTSILLSCIFISACASPAPAPTATATPIPPTPSATVTATLTLTSTLTATLLPTPAATEISPADKLLAEFDGLTDKDTYDTIMHTTVDKLLAATGKENPTFQDVAAMLNKYGNEHTTWPDGTPYVTLLEAREFEKGKQALTFDLTEPMKLPTDVSVRYKVMYVKGNLIPGMEAKYDDMTLVTATWLVEGEKNMSATIMTDGDVVKEQLVLLADCIGVKRQKMITPMFYTSGLSSDIFKEKMVMDAEKVTVDVVVNPITGEKRNEKLEDLWLGVAKRIAGINEPTYIPLTSASREEVQEWLNLAIFPGSAFKGATDFNVNE